MSRIAIVDPGTSRGQAKALLESVRQAHGTVPNVARVMANQPVVLEGYLGFADALSRGGFDARTRLALALTVAGANACGYCASAHAAASLALKVDRDEIERQLAGASRDPGLDAGLRFARAVVAKRGLVSDHDLARVRSAGYSDSQITEIVANVALNLLTNYVNHVADTDVDFPFTDPTAYQV